MAKILILDDDSSITDTVEDALSTAGYLVDSASEAALAEEMMKASEYDLLILDWMMPEITGIEFLKKIRIAGMNLPVLMLTGMNSIENKETGLDSGADDYLTKPFSARELIARVRALLRRPRALETSTTLTVGDLTLDTRTLKVTFCGQDVKTTRQEFLLLEFLMRNKGQVFRSDALVERAWSTLSESSPDTVRVHMFRLRKKLESISEICPIRTLHGQGYVLSTNTEKDDESSGEP